MVLFFATMSILGIWGVIEVEKIMFKSITTMIVIFIATALILFIVSVIYKTNGNAQRVPPPQGDGGNLL